MTRLEANLAILNELHILAERNKDLRFHQLLALANVNVLECEDAIPGCAPSIKDDFYTESETILNRMSK